MATASIRALDMELTQVELTGWSVITGPYLLLSVAQNQLTYLGNFDITEKENFTGIL